MNDDLTPLQNIVRIGTVESVNPENRTARVRFSDKNNLVSGELKVLQNHPLIVIEKEVDGEKWASTAKYASADRALSGGSVSYTKAAPDEITLTKSIDYEKVNTTSEPGSSCGKTGVLETKTHKHKETIYPWLPYIGQMVLCIFLPIGGGDGFVIGGI
jgi:hypothetical protein